MYKGAVGLYKQFIFQLLIKNHLNENEKDDEDCLNSNIGHVSNLWPDYNCQH